MNRPRANDAPPIARSALAALPPGGPSTYSLYGLKVRSDLPLPLPPLPAADDAEMVVRFAGYCPRATENLSGHPARLWQRQGNQWLLRFQNPAGHRLDFRYDLAGTAIEIEQSYPDWQDSLFVLLGVGIGTALRLRDITAFHATSLVCDGRAHLLMGQSGAGKSTLAAALAAEGMALHADDIAVLRWREGIPCIAAGYPRLKVTPATAAALGWAATALLPVFPGLPDYPERWLDATTLPAGFHNAAAPLATIFLLAERDAALTGPRLIRLSPSQAALALTQHLFVPDYLERPPMLDLMHRCRRVAATTPIYRLQLPDSLPRLRQAASALLGELAGGPG